MPSQDMKMVMALAGIGTEVSLEDLKVHALDVKGLPAGTFFVLQLFSDALAMNDPLKNLKTKDPIFL
jgi:hypothetical protein